jgi:hypothetical protein
LTCGTASPTLSTATSSTSWSTSMPDDWMTTLGSRRGHPLEDRGRADDMDLGRVDGLVAQRHRRRRLAMVDLDGHDLVAKLIEVDGHVLRLEPEHADARVDRFKVDGQADRATVRIDVGEVDPRLEVGLDRPDVGRCEVADLGHGPDGLEQERVGWLVPHIHGDDACQGRRAL